MLNYLLKSMLKYSLEYWTYSNYSFAVAMRITLVAALILPLFGNRLSAQEVPDNLTNMSRSLTLPARDTNELPSLPSETPPASSEQVPSESTPATTPQTPTTPAPVTPAPVTPAPAPASTTTPAPVAPAATTPGNDAAAPPVETVSHVVVEQAVPSEKEDNLISERRKNLRTPRRLFDFLNQCFSLNEYRHASLAFDLTDFNEVSDYEKKMLAYHLMIVLSRITLLDQTDSIPDDDTLDEYTFQPNMNCSPLILKKVDGYYVITDKSLHELVARFDEVRELPPLVNTATFPIIWQDWWFKTYFGFSYIQWATLFVSFFLGLLVGKIAAKLLYYMTLAPFHLFQRDPKAYHISQKTWTPMGWFITYSVWYLGILAIKPQPIIAEAVGWPLHFLALIMFMFTAFRLTDVAAEILRTRVKIHYTKIDEILVPLFQRSVKILIACTAIVWAIQMLGFSAIGVISGMGIGGIAIALAAQNTIANFLGSLTVLMDRPFVIGDWILTGNVEGEVESVGLRSTRIRTFYNSLVTIPNNFLTTAVIDNMGRRHFRRYKTLLQITYETPTDQIEAFCEGIRELIISYPNTRKDLFHVWVNELGASSIDILLICFFLVPDSAAEYRARSILILDILRLAEKMKISFAYPTQTVYTIPSSDETKVEPPEIFDPEQAQQLADAIIDERKQNALSKSPH